MATAVHMSGDDIIVVLEEITLICFILSLLSTTPPSFPLNFSSTPHSSEYLDSCRESGLEGTGGEAYLWCL